MGTSNRDIFSADMVAATRRNGGTQPSQSATPLEAGCCLVCDPSKEESECYMLQETWY